MAKEARVPPAPEPSAELRLANQRLLVAGLHAQALADAQAVSNAALQELLAVRDRAAADCDAVLAQERAALLQAEAARLRAEELADQSARQGRTLGALLEASPDHVFLVDPQGRFTYVNHGAATAMAAAVSASHADATTIVGRTGRELGFAEDFLQQFEADHARALGGETTLGETLFQSPLGRRTFEYVLSPVKGVDGTVQGVVGVARDVQERTLADRANRDRLIAERAARSQAEDAVRIRDEFLAVAAHELKTPATTVKGLAQMTLRLLASGTLDTAKVTRYQEGIVEATNYQVALLTDLLDVSRMRHGGPMVHPTRMDFGALLQAVVEGYTQQLAGGHRLDLERSGNPLLVKGDAVRLKQVLDNLLGNALKYSPAGGSVQVAAREIDGSIELTVQDAGVGLPPGEEERIFEPFERASNVREHGIPGQGLGLYVCRQIVEAHGGRIWAEHRGDGTTPGHPGGTGSTFHVVLPGLPRVAADEDVSAP